MLEKEIARYNPIQADSEITHFLLNSISDIFEDEFITPELGENEYEESSHYWNQFLEYLDSNTIRFVHSLDDFATESEKAYVWILIELHNKTIAHIFQEIATTEAIMFHYSPRSLIKRHYTDIQDILNRLCKIEYKIESKFLQVYEKNELNYNNHYETGSEIQQNVNQSSPRKSISYDPDRHKPSLDSPIIDPVLSASPTNTRTSSFLKSGSSAKVQLENTIENQKNRPDMIILENSKDDYNIKGEAAIGENYIFPEGEIESTITPQWKPKFLVDHLFIFR